MNGTEIQQKLKAALKQSKTNYNELNTKYGELRDQYKEMKPLIKEKRDAKKAIKAILSKYTSELDNVNVEGNAALTEMNNFLSGI